MHMIVNASVTFLICLPQYLPSLPPFHRPHKLAQSHGQTHGSLLAHTLRLSLHRVVRHSEGEAVGTVCLNLTKCPGPAAGSKLESQPADQASPFGQALAAALRFLGRRCVELPMSMQTVSILTCSPTVSGRSQSGLDSPSETHVLDFLVLARPKALPGLPKHFAL